MPVEVGACPRHFPPVRLWAHYHCKRGSRGSPVRAAPRTTRAARRALRPMRETELAPKTWKVLRLLTLRKGPRPVLPQGCLGPQTRTPAGTPPPNPGAGRQRGLAESRAGAGPAAQTGNRRPRKSERRRGEGLGPSPGRASSSALRDRLSGSSPAPPVKDSPDRTEGRGLNCLFPHRQATPFRPQSSP